MLALVFALTAIHFVAIAIVSQVYKHPVDDSLLHMLDTHAQQLAHRKSGGSPWPWRGRRR